MKRSISVRFGCSCPCGRGPDSRRTHSHGGRRGRWFSPAPGEPATHWGRRSPPPIVSARSSSRRANHGTTSRAAPSKAATTSREGPERPRVVGSARRVHYPSATRRTRISTRSCTGRSPARPPSTSPSQGRETPNEPGSRPTSGQPAPDHPTPTAITAHLQIIQTCTALLGGAAPHFHDGL